MGDGQMTTPATLTEYVASGKVHLGISARSAMSHQPAMTHVLYAKDHRWHTLCAHEPAHRRTKISEVARDCLTCLSILGADGEGPA
jgi:hypothetical protein